jgi:hypothetical protein
MIHKCVTGLSAAASLFVLGAERAQAAATDLLILAQQQGGVTKTVAGARNWVVEGLVVVVLSGLALFAICKSSRRV